MKFKVLGCYGGELPGYDLTSFLIDDRLLLDAGTVGSALSVEEQAAITDILISHYHFDHIKGLPFYAVNIFGMIPEAVRIHSSAEIVDGVRRFLLNDIVWPDFTSIPSNEAPIFRYSPIEVGRSHNIAGYQVTPIPVHHLVPTVGFIIRDAESAICFTSDTAPTEAIWTALEEFGPDGVSEKGVKLKAIITEVSFPNAMQGVASASMHLTPRDLEREVEKIPVKNVPLYIYHIKPQSLKEICNELDAGSFGDFEPQLLQQGETYIF